MLSAGVNTILLALDVIIELGKDPREFLSSPLIRVATVLALFEIGYFLYRSKKRLSKSPNAA